MDTENSVKEVISRLEELKKLRADVHSFNEELAVRDKDLADAERIYGVTSKEYEVKKNHFDTTSSKIEELNAKISELSYKKSELKPVLDDLTKQFEVAYKAETSKEYHIELASEGKNGKKIYKQLLEYLYHNVSFTPKTAANLMVLVRNMEENKPFVNSQEFDNVILLRSASVISLWRFIIEDMSGKGFYEARTFLECWANCGQSVSDAVREIQKDSEVSRKIGANLNLVEEEFDISEDDLPHDSELTTKEEVAPEV